MRVIKSYNDEIVQIVDSPCIYIDEDFYSSHFKEEKDVKKQGFKSFPVKIECLNVGWIINSDEGRELLQNILDSEKIEYFEIPTLVMIIEFLYQRNKLLILGVPLNLYIL
jgi:hypothetical protein